MTACGLSCWRVGGGGGRGGPVPGGGGGGLVGGAARRVGVGAGAADDGLRVELLAGAGVADPRAPVPGRELGGHREGYSSRCGAAVITRCAKSTLSPLTIGPSARFRAHWTHRDGW